MPLVDLERVRERLPGVELRDGTGVLRALRSVKSEAEIARVRYVCRIVSATFEALPAKLAVDETERDACRKLRIDVLERGADDVPFMPGVAGPGGYDNIIMGPTDRVVESGDILIIDTGATYDGYYCDFGRNYAFCGVSDEARRAHEVVWEAKQAGIHAARPGATTGPRVSGLAQLGLQASNFASSRSITALT